MLVLLGRCYVALSLALPSVALVIAAFWISRFKENGPQSAGTGPLVLTLATVLGVLTVNALLAGLLAWLQPACRTSFAVVALLVAGLVVMAAFATWIINR